MMRSPSDMTHGERLRDSKPSKRKARALCTLAHHMQTFWEKNQGLHALIS